MPSVPGSLLDIIDDQAGTVIGGSQLRSRPELPRPMRASRLGSAPRKSSKTRRGSAQSRPITTTLRLLLSVTVGSFGLRAGRAGAQLFVLDQSDRRASIGLRRAALTAGRRPNVTPVPAE